MKRIIPSRLIVPALAIAGLAATLVVVASGDRAYPVQPPVAAPATTPYASTIAGAGIIEASSRNIALATPLPGIVARVLVEAGDRVAAGAPLFTLDERPLTAELAMRQAALATAQAREREARAQHLEAEDQLAKVEALDDPRAVSAEEIVRRRQAAEVARARLELARAGIAEAQAAITRVKLDLERLTVRAPIAGEILQLNLRPGEHVSPSDPVAPAMLGNTQTLHVRVDIDETEAARFQPGAKAVAHLRGDGGTTIPLRFVRVEPLVVPKKSLTGGSAERVDTRVLQVLFAFERDTRSVYVGQQVDVYIDAGARS